MKFTRFFGLSFVVLILASRGAWSSFGTESAKQDSANPHAAPQSKNVAIDPRARLQPVHFEYVDQLAITQKCDGIYDRLVYNSAAIQASIDLLSYSWEHNENITALDEICSFHEGPYSPDQGENASDFLIKKQTAIRAVLKNETKRISNLKVPPLLEELKREKLVDLKLRYFIDDALIRHTILRGNARAKTKQVIFPLIQNYQAQKIHPVCLAYARLTTAAQDSEVEEKLNVLMEKQSLLWRRSTNLNVLHHFRDDGERACIAGWKYWNQCLLDQFGSGHAARSPRMEIQILNQLFQSLRCQSDSNKS